MNLKHRLRIGGVLVAASVAGTVTQVGATGPTHPPLAGAYCSGGVSVSGPGSTAQVNAVPGFNGVLAGGGESDVLNNVLPACAESVSDSGGGSGAGIASQVGRTAAIGFSDDPLNAETQATAVAGSGTNASPIHTVPVAILPVSVIVNLPCYSGTLKLTSVDIAKMYDGVIKVWSHQLLNVDNPGISTSCSNVPVRLVARADVSGTTYVFKSYLSHRNPEYDALKQDAANTTWLGAIACRGAGTGGVISCVQNTADSIGYAASSNARNAGMREAKIDNAAHSFATWSAGACSTAALAAPIPPSTLGNWSASDFTDEPVGYGICGYTYDLVFALQKTAFSSSPSLSSPQVTQTLIDFLTAATSARGQASLPTSQYDKLPAPTEKVAQLAPYEIAYK